MMEHSSTKFKNLAIQGYHIYKDDKVLYYGLEIRKLSYPCAVATKKLPSELMQLFGGTFLVLCMQCVQFF